MMVISTITYIYHKIQYIPASDKINFLVSIGDSVFPMRIKRFSFYYILCLFLVIARLLVAIMLAGNSVDA